MDGGELHAKGTENIFNKTIKEKSPNIDNKISIQVYEAYRTLNG